MSEKEEQQEQEEILAEDLLAYKRMTPSQIRKRQQTKKRNRGKNIQKKRKNRQKYRRKRNKFKLRRKKWNRRTRGRRRYADMLEAIWFKEADMGVYEIRPPDIDELYIPSGTSYTPSGGQSVWKFDPANRNRKPSEKQDTEKEQNDVGNSSRVVPNGQFVTAGDSLLTQQNDLVEELKTLKEIYDKIERVASRSLSRTDRGSFEKLVVLISKGSRSINQAIDLAQDLGLSGNLREEVSSQIQYVLDELQGVREQVAEANRKDDARMDSLLEKWFPNVGQILREEDYDQ